MKARAVDELGWRVGGRARGGHGIRVRTLVWLGRTTPKWRRSRVAIVVRWRRSATVIRLASTPPRGWSEYRWVSSAMRDDGLAVGDRSIERRFGAGPELAVQ
jgi:hypothetical protein